MLPLLAVWVTGPGLCREERNTARSQLNYFILVEFDILYACSRIKFLHVMWSDLNIMASVSQLLYKRVNSACVRLKPKREKTPTL
jgi:hypothetical protein